MALKNIFKLKKKQSFSDDGAQRSTQAALSPANSDSPAVSVETSGPSPESSATSSVYASANTSSSTVYEQYSQLSRRQDFPQELTPIVTLLNCQAGRVYAEGEVLLNVELNGTEEHDDDLFFQPAEATLRGTSLFLSSTAVKPITLDLLEATVRVQEQYLSLVLSTTHRAAHHIKFDDLEELQGWLTSIYLSIYEHTRLSLCYTASLLSAKATQLSDLHVVMNELKFNKEEWVNIKFSKNSQWLRCFMVVSPGTNKNNGTVQFYSSQKTAKKNLICALSTIDNCHAVYPSVVELIDNSALIKLQGDITFYNLGAATTDSGSSPLPSQPSSPNPNQQHKRHTSMSSITSIGSSKSMKGYPVHKTSLYILPQQHGGVKPYETMIRVLMPLYDSFKMYGRPKRLVPDKRDESSLLFGLPSLPRVKLFTHSMARNLVQDNWTLLISDDGAFFELFDTQLKSLYDTDASFGGFGDLRESVQKESKFEHPFTRRMSITSGSFDSNLTPKYALSVNDYPVGLSSEALDQIQQSAQGIQRTTASTGRVRSTSTNSYNNIQHARRESRASQLRAESYTNLNSLMEGAQIS